MHSRPAPASTRAELTLQRLSAVLAAYGRGRATFYRDIQRGLWTQPVKVGDRFAAWPSHETQALVAAIAGGATQDQVKTLVTRLHEQRRSGFADVCSRYLSSPAAGGAE